MGLRVGFRQVYGDGLPVDEVLDGASGALHFADPLPKAAVVLARFAAKESNVLVSQVSQPRFEPMFFEPPAPSSLVLPVVDEPIQVAVTPG